MAKTVLDNCDNVALWTSSDDTNFTKSQDTGDKQEGTGSIKVVASSDVVWIKEYDGAAEPDSGGNYDWTLGGTDSVSSDGDILTLNTVGIGTRYNYYSQAPDVNFDNGFTLEARVKIIDCETTGFFLILISDGTQDEHVVFKLFEDKIDVRGTQYNMNTTDDFHIYRITVSGTTIKVYVDGIERISASVFVEATDDRVIFGDDRSATGLNVNAQMDYLNYKLGEAKSPREFENDTITRDLGA